jgi:hypothetical protein
VAWITVDDVAGALGLPPASAVDEAWLASATEASNSVALRRRRAAGYIDNPDVVPDGAVFHGTVQYAVMLYKERGSIDGGQASFDELGQFTPTGSTWTTILRLWACNRPATG